jgi:aspartyl-tRNA(Asn)/glutamyl-tRNA(Gln) amidotransferase subunit C
MSISRKDVEHVAGLAHLALTDDEIERMVADLNTILDYAAHLDALDLEGIDPAKITDAETTPLRPDEAEPGLPPGKATSLAPASGEDLFKVPPAFGGD